MSTKPKQMLNLQLLARDQHFGGLPNRLPKRKYNWPKEKSFYEDTLQKDSEVLLDGLLEGLSDVRVALTWLRQQLLSGKKVILIFGYTDGWWSWNQAQMQALLHSAGIFVDSVELLSGGLHRAQLICTQEQYDQFLQSAKLPPTNIEHLIVTTEHSEYRVTGGIGSYVKEASSLYGPKAGVLVMDSNKDLDMSRIRSNKWFSAQTFLSRARIDQIDASNFDTISDIVLEALESLLCLYPGIRSIEAQEMLLYRAIEAKKLGLLAANPKFITVCHGSSFHLSKANRDVLPAENIHVAYREKLTLEESDTVIFPTNYLRESYRDYGVERLDDASRVIKRLPFDYTRMPDGKPLRTYKRLLYVGKTSTIKGFDLFLETIDELYKTNPNLLASFEEILVVATSVDIVEPHLQNLFYHLAEVLPVRIVSLNREDLLKAYAEYSADTIALVTYRGDNHPLAVLELMAVGLDFLAANAAGTPELIPKHYKKDYLVEQTPRAFANAVEKAAANTQERARLIAGLRTAYRAEQSTINNQYSIAYFKDLPFLSTAKSVKNKNKIRVQIVDTGDKQALAETVASLKNQTYDSIDYDITEKQEAGLPHMRLFAGDVLRPDAVELMVAALEIPDRACVLSYEESPTYHGSEFRGIEEFHPFPPQLGSVFLQEKYSRRFVAMFASDTVAPHRFSDWQKAVYVKSKGGTVAVVPQLLIRLAVQHDYPNANKQQEISNAVHSFAALPVFDAYILHSELTRFDDIYWGLKLRGHLPDHFVRRDDPTILHGNTPLLSKTIDIYKNRLPKRVKNTIRYSIRATYKVARTVRRKPKRS